MSKSERKSENVPTPNVLSRLAQKDKQGDEGFQRALLLILLVVLLTFIIVPKGALTPTEFTAGDIVPRDIKAPRDILIPDDDLSEQKRADAERAVANLYDYDPSTGAIISERVDQILSSLNASLDQEVTEEQQISDLETNFGVKADKKSFAALKELSAQDEDKSRVTNILLPLYRQKIAGNLKLFEADRTKGVIFRSLDTQAEASDNIQNVVIGLGQLQDLLKKALKDTDLSAKHQKALLELIVPLLRPNISFNQNETEARKQFSREEVKPVLIQVKKGEMIAREGDRITPDQIKRLGALRDDSSTVSLWRNAMGMLISCFLLVYFAWACSSAVFFLSISLTLLPARIFANIVLKTAIWCSCRWFLLSIFWS